MIESAPKTQANAKDHCAQNDPIKKTNVRATAAAKTQYLPRDLILRIIVTFN